MASLKKYDDDIVKEIRDTVETIRVYGTDVILKESPGRKGKGFMDPYEKAVMKDNWAAGGNGESGNPFESDLPPEKMIPFLRDIMGFANLNLNTKEIITKYETIEADGNIIGLWRYYLRRGTREQKPCLIYIHGGGWIGGSVYCTENPCKLICEMSDAVVFNVDYDLAPELQFPGALNECCDVVKHIYEHADEYGIDKNRITIARDSAGVDTTIYRYCGCTHAIIDRLGYQPQTEEICLTIAETL